MSDLGETKVSATLIIISRDNKALIVQRRYKDSWGGKWTVVGGKLSGDDGVKITEGFKYFPAEACVIREAKEEAGVIVDMEKLKYLCTIVTDIKNRVILSYYTVLDKDAKDIKIKANLSELRDYAWITNDETHNYDFIPDIGGEIREVFKLLGEGNA